MPLAKRIIEPVRLNRKPVPPDKSSEIDVDLSCNLALVDILRQLGAVALKADEIFGEIAQECQMVTNRTERLRNKVWDVGNKVEGLNARAVRVRKYILQHVPLAGDQWFACCHPFVWCFRYLVGTGV